jgi:hypothetical protein
MDDPHSKKLNLNKSNIMLVFLAPDCVAKLARSAATNQFCALSAAMSSIAKNPAHKSWKLFKNHS